MHHEPIVDEAALERLRRLGGDKLVVQIVRLYLENAAERVRQVDAGLAPGGDLQQAEAGAHALKSSAANVGAMRVSALAARMEETARAGDDAAVRELRPLLVAAVVDAEARLRELTGREEP